MKTSAKSSRNVAQTAAMMVILTLISKCFGFIRETVMAAYFGVGYITDSYVMAQSIPKILFGGIFAAIATSYMPLFSDITENKGTKAGDLFTSRIINTLILLSVIASLLGFVFSEQIVTVLARGFDAERIQLTSFFLRITFLYTFFSATASILDAYLQYKGIFISQIIAGYALNIMTIITIVFSAFTSHYFLAFGMLLGQAVRFFVVFFASRKKGFSYYCSFQLTENIKKVLILAIPVFISSSIEQINTFVDKMLASNLEVGSISALYYAMLLVTLITSLTSSIFSTIIYPKLAQANALSDTRKLSEITAIGVNLILIVTVPFSLGIFIYGKQVVEIIYERGAFDQLASQLTGSAFIFYGIGLTFLAINEFLLRVYYSLKDMKLPMYFAMAGVVINIILNLILVRHMQHNGLALATSLAFLTNTVLLSLGIKIKYREILSFGSKIKILKILFSSACAVTGSYIVYLLSVPYFLGFVFANILHLILAIVIAIMIYLLLLWLLKIEELYFIKNLLRK
ncbi:murein biosynthesis integral membrane protein MurJ [Aminipila sp.]|uniref:murein biosynthesis integral membrane protein MurJ n=1 Tax=Aminipila sp. TaxID=2060095 RepID=UPI001D217E78|nr:murein biosynthesis integral membrane protein MurJ [Aminipila sp.]MBE6034893.1 murein biosynthesis integral membrane protein MurJ [Clostridiales bacterium]